MHVRAYTCVCPGVCLIVSVCGVSLSLILNCPSLQEGKKDFCIVQIVKASSKPFKALNTCRVI